MVCLLSGLAEYIEKQNVVRYYENGSHMDNVAARSIDFYRYDFEML
jgi:hypothetical protein